MYPLTSTPPFFGSVQVGLVDRPCVDAKLFGYVED